MAEFEGGLTYHNFGSRYLRQRSPYLKGTDVKVLQHLLNRLPEKLRGEGLEEDGIYGSITEAAVRHYQEAVGLRVDGIVGPQTFYSFGKETGSYIEEGPEFGSRDLKVRMEGGDVSVLQNRLNALGRRFARLSRVPADGVFGPRTRQLVRCFQISVSRQDRGIPTCGEVGFETFNALYIFTSMGGRTLSSCTSGFDVYWLQCFLQACGIYNGKMDGIFGPLTEKAVQEFQKEKGITSDGIVGRVTFFTIGMSS